MHDVRTGQGITVFHVLWCKGILEHDVRTGQGIAVFHVWWCKGILVHDVRTGQARNSRLPRIGV